MTNIRLNNKQIKAFGLAVGVSIVAAAGTMFVPVSMIESITGSTGISEMVPATAAPLGDTARAIIAFIGGALSFLLMLALMLREEKPGSNQKVEPDDLDHFEDRPGILEGLRVRFSALSLPKMPWSSDDDDILDLADLPKLRSNDAHPDAPPRRPLFASSDLVETALPEFLNEQQAADIAEDCEAITQSEVRGEVDASVDAIQIVEDYLIESTDIPSLAEMVEQLEASLEQRKAQLTELEKVARELVAKEDAPVEEAQISTEPAIAEPEIEAEMPAKDIPVTRPPLTAVPSVDDEEEEMDAALDAALQTLHRMNGQAR